VEAAKNKVRVLLVDADIQASALGFRGLRDKEDIKAMALPSNKLDQDLPSFNFDLIIVDAGGRDTKVFRSAILAADILLMPVLPSQYDIWASGETIEILNLCRGRKEIGAFFVLNQIIPNTKVSREAELALKEFEKDVPVLNTKLYSRVAYKTSINEGLGVTEYEPDGKAAAEIRELYSELKEKLRF